jgi:hypothetical protein
MRSSRRIVDSPFEREFDDDGSYLLRTDSGLVKLLQRYEEIERSEMLCDVPSRCRRMHVNLGQFDSR